MNNEYTPKPTWRLCIVCGERIIDDSQMVGGRVKRGGTRCAHKACWEQEQAALAGKEERDTWK